MRVLTVLGYAVSGFILLSMSGCMSAPSSSTSSISSLEILSMDPPSPAKLKAGDKVKVRVRYDMGVCNSVQIWVRSNSSSRGEISHPCSPMPRSNGQTGTMEGWFYFDDTAQVKEIRVLMKDVANKAFVYEITKTVNYQWSSSPAPLPPDKFEGTTRIPASYTWDVDTDTIGGNSKNVDLWWKWDRSSQQSIVARNDAGMTILTNLSFDQIDLERLRNCSYDQKALSLSGNDSLVKPGLQLGLKTSEGRYAKLEVLSDGFPKNLVFRWKLYPDSEVRESKSPNPPRSDPVKRYGGLWYYADPWGRPDDRIAVLEGRIDGRNVLSFELVKHFCSSKPVCGETLTQKDQIEIRFDDVRYPGSDKPGTTMRYSLLYQEGALLGQVFRDGMEPEKVVLRRPDSTMMNQIISGLGRENREMRFRLEREQTQAASEKNALKSNLELLEKTNGQLRSENSDLSDQNEKVLKMVQALEDMLRQANGTKQD